jgi:hypothetical protein
MYTAHRWHDFYVMVGGASAALTGLIFVAISIHLRSVLATPLFRARARYITGGLMLSLVTSALVLAPGQTRQALGIELVVLGLMTGVAFAVPVARLDRIAPPDVDVRIRHLFAWTAQALWVLSGLSLIVAWGGGFYLLLIAVLIALSTCVGGAWSLLTGSEARQELEEAARSRESTTRATASPDGGAQTKSPMGRLGG